MRDHPDIKEMKELMAFCGGRKYVYIYGCAENQMRLEKYLSICGMNTRGFVIGDTHAPAEGLRCIRLGELPACDKADAGIILGLPDRYYNEIVADLWDRGFEHIFFLSERGKQTISKSLAPKKKEELYIEINLAEHCNLNCWGCNHYSPLAATEFIDQAVLERDLKRLSELTDGYISHVSLLGGEPLLHPNIIKCLDSARRHFPRTPDKKTKVVIITNGILLVNPPSREWDENLWRKCAELDIAFDVTCYPIGLDYSSVFEKAGRYNVEAYFRDNNKGKDRPQKAKSSLRFTLSPTKNVAPWQFISCLQFNRCSVLKNGRIYPCPTISQIGHLNKHFGLDFQTEEDDYIDIFAVESYEEIAEFLAMRTPFCGYCDIENRTSMPWGTSKRTLEEYIV